MKTKTFWIEGEETCYKPSYASDSYSGPYNSSSSGNYNYYGNYGPSYGNYNYYGTNYNSGYDNYAFTPYTSLTPGVQTAVTFHLLLDPRSIKENEHIVISGNLDIMGAGGDGIPMHAELDNIIWTITLNLVII